MANFSGLNIETYFKIADIFKIKAAVLFPKPSFNYFCINVSHNQIFHASMKESLPVDNFSCLFRVTN